MKTELCKNTIVFVINLDVHTKLNDDFIYGSEQERIIIDSDSDAMEYFIEQRKLLDTMCKDLEKYIWKKYRKDVCVESKLSYLKSFKQRGD